MAETNQALFEQFQRFEEMQLGQKNTPTSLVPVGPYGHGQGGLFSQAGSDNRVFSAIMGNQPGLINRIPVFNAANDMPDGQSMFGGTDAEFFTTITGVTQGALETFANQPTTKCADGPRAGLMKVCTLVSGFGRFRFSPNAPVNIFDAGRRRDILDPVALQLMNSPIMNKFGVPSAAGTANSRNALVNELAKRMFEMGVSISRFMAPRVYIGTPANNNGEARDITGLDIHINVNNKRDAYTQNLCTAMNSDIKDFNFNLVHRNVVDIQAYAEAIVAWLDWNVRHQGLGENWDGVIALRPELWEEISKVIAIRQYNEVIAQGIAVNGANAVLNLNVDAATMLNMRNQLRSGLRWPLRGREIEVVLDEGITEVTPNQNANLQPGQYASDIYFVPMRVLGGIPVTYWKFFDHTNGNSEDLARMAGNSTFTSDGGLFRWYVNFKNGCIDWTVDWSPRLLMLTPQIAARIQNVAYQPLQHFRSADPASSYFANGGRLNSPTTQFYTAYGNAGTEPQHFDM